MKLVHFIRFRAFSYPDDDAKRIRKAIEELIPFSLEQARLAVQTTTATGFQEKKIHILSLELKKDQHCNAFLKHFRGLLSTEQRQMLLKQHNRLDDQLDFFIRLDLEELSQGRLLITEKGKCLHITLSIAAFPKNRIQAQRVLEQIFG